MDTLWIGLSVLGILSLTGETLYWLRHKKQVTVTNNVEAGELPQVPAPEENLPAPPR
jgi:hypothetical protein